MKVREIMTSEVRTCRPEENVASAGSKMWQEDCGILPVVAEDEKVVGVITDRDICMALVTRGARPGDVRVQDVVPHGDVFSCRPEDSVQSALHEMAARQVRRLPVVDEEGRLQGILSLNDIAIAANDNKGKKGVSYKEVAEAFRKICRQREEATAVPFE